MEGRSERTFMSLGLPYVEYRHRWGDSEGSSLSCDVLTAVKEYGFICAKEWPKSEGEEKLT